MDEFFFFRWGNPFSFLLPFYKSIFSPDWPTISTAALRISYYHGVPRKTYIRFCRIDCGSENGCVTHDITKKMVRRYTGACACVSCSQKSAASPGSGRPPLIAFFFLPTDVSVRLHAAVVPYLLVTLDLWLLGESDRIGISPSLPPFMCFAEGDLHCHGVTIGKFAGARYYRCSIVSRDYQIQLLMCHAHERRRL
jgi:hypothetical protein